MAKENKTLNLFKDMIKDDINSPSSAVMENNIKEIKADNTTGGSNKLDQSEFVEPVQESANSIEPIIVSDSNVNFIDNLETSHENSANSDIPKSLDPNSEPNVTLCINMSKSCFEKLRLIKKEFNNNQSEAIRTLIEEDYIKNGDYYKSIKSGRK